jgi:nicotinamidase-related amidase
MNFNDNPALILVNFQLGFLEQSYWGYNFSTPNMFSNSRKILEIWRELGLSVIHVQHHSEDPDSPLHPEKETVNFSPEFNPKNDEKVIIKKSQSIFFNNDLQEYLIAKNIKKLVFIGFRTNVSISTSIRVARDMLFEPYIVSDATCTFDKIGFDGIKYPAEILHQSELTSLRLESANIITTQQIELFYNHQK